MDISELITTESFPQLKRALWRSRSIELSAYHLADETFVFTFRQIANPVGQPSQSVTHFLQETQPVEPVISAYLPNRLLASVCTLRTAAQYWKYLDLTQTEQTNQANSKARQLWLDAEHYLNSLANGSDYPVSSALSDRCSEPGCVKVINIFHVKLLDCTNAALRVLVCRHGNQEILYLIDVASFLELLGIKFDLLARPSSLVRRFQKTFGLMREPLTCYLENGEEVLTFTLSDCLAICEYLILKKGNSRAADFLIALGRIPLEARCQPYSLQSDRTCQSNGSELLQPHRTGG